MTALPVRPAHELTLLAAEQRWLIEGLWGREAVGIVGGEPKCCKSFLALDMAVAVASATPCLRRFHVARPGRVLLFAAEDALSIVRQRLDGICATIGLSLADLDLLVITVPTLRLDLELDRNRLDDTVRALHPTLLVLDPFVRLHRIDENISADVAPLLDYLRSLQRRYQTAVVLVHHARKGAAHLRAGQALRGSSELHAWGDSNLYLRRTGAGDGLALTIEHRAAASSEGLALRLLATVTASRCIWTTNPSPNSSTPPLRALSIASKPSSPPPRPLSPSKPCAQPPKCAQPLPPTLSPRSLLRAARDALTKAKSTSRVDPLPLGSRFPIPKHPGRCPESESGIALNNPPTSSTVTPFLSNSVTSL